MVSRIVCLTMLVAVAHAATFAGYLPPKPLELGECDLKNILLVLCKIFKFKIILLYIKNIVTALLLYIFRLLNRKWADYYDYVWFIMTTRNNELYNLYPFIKVIASRNT